MVYYLQSAHESNRILEILEEVNIRGEMVEVLVKVEDIIEQQKDEVVELLEELGKVNHENFRNLIIAAQLLYLYEEKYYIFLEPDFHFNRYRLKTLRASIYNKTRSFDVQKARSFCRTKEREAAKSGYQSNIWSNSAAEKLFGKAEESGDFTGNGSPGWKLNAFANYAFDYFCLEKDLKLIRLSYYDTLMVQGKLETIGKHLKMRNESFNKPIQQLLARKIGVNLPQS